MDLKTFYNIYIPALEKAFKNEDNKEVFETNGASFYIEDESLALEIDLYLEKNENDFTEKVAYYFDAKSHNFPEVSGIKIDEYRKEIIEGLNKLKEKYKIE